MTDNPESFSSVTNRINAQLAAARAIPDARERVRALTDLLWYLPDGLKAEVAREVLVAARAFTDAECWARATINLILHLPDSLQAEVASKALVMAPNSFVTNFTDGIGWRGNMLEMISFLPAAREIERATEMLAAARAITDGQERVRALTDVFLYSPAELKVEVARDALATARTITEHHGLP